MGPGIRSVGWAAWDDILGDVERLRDWVLGRREVSMVSGRRSTVYGVLNG